MTPSTRSPLELTDVTDAPASAADACVPLLENVPLTADDAAQTTRVLKAVAEPLRLRMLSYLLQSGVNEACVCDLAELASLSQPTVSHHLKVLREAGIVTSERRGTWVWYAIAPAYDAAVRTLLDTFAPSLPASSRSTTEEIS